MLLLFLKYTVAATGCAEALTRDILLKKVLLKISRASQENTCIVAFFQVAGLQPASFLKRDSNTSAILSFFQIFKSTYFEEHLQMNASGGVLSCS